MNIVFASTTIKNVVERIIARKPKIYCWEDITDLNAGEDFSYRLLVEWKKCFFEIAVIFDKNGQSYLSIEHDYDPRYDFFKKLIEFKFDDGRLVGVCDENCEGDKWSVTSSYGTLARLKRKFGFDCEILLMFVCCSNLSDWQKSRVADLLFILYKIPTGNQCRLRKQMNLADVKREGESLPLSGH